MVYSRQREDNREGPGWRNLGLSASLKVMAAIQVLFNTSVHRLTPLRLEQPPTCMINQSCRDMTSNAQTTDRLMMVNQSSPKNSIGNVQNVRKPSTDLCGIKRHGLFIKKNCYLKHQRCLDILMNSINLSQKNKIIIKKQFIWMFTHAARRQLRFCRRGV